MSVHSLEFYDNDAYLAEHVAARILDATAAGRSCIAILTETHRGALAAVLGPQISTIETHDTTAVIDALTVDGRVDRAAFVAHVAPLLRANVLVIGDVSDTLYRRGRRDDAFELERLFVEVLEKVSFDALCAYSDDVAAEDAAALRATHQHRND